MALETGEPKRKKREPRFVPPRDPTALGFGPALPTCGNDLVGLWELPQEAVTQARLKIARTIPMSTKLELMRECTVQDYSLESVAHSFGPGEYEIILNPGPQNAWKLRRARINVSPKYATECGFTVFQDNPPTIAPPRFSEVRSLRETADAIDRGQSLTLERLAGLMETMIERVAERMKPAPVVDPMANFQSMLSIMNLMRTEQNSALENAIKLVNMRGDSPRFPDESEDDSWPGVIREALPLVKDIATGFISRMGAPGRAGDLAQSGRELRKSEDENEEGETVTVPLSDDEIRRFAAMVALLQPHGELIVKVIETRPNPRDAAAELAGSIPSPLRGTMVQFAEIVAERGPGALGIIDRRLVTDKGAAVVVGIGEILRGA